MADASMALGSTQVAGLLVNPCGARRETVTSATCGQVAGLVGGLAVAAANARRASAVPEMPRFGSTGYLAASDDELVLLRTSSRGLRSRPCGEPLVRVRRSELASLALQERAMVSKLHVVFTDGGCWEFDIPRAGRNRARRFVDALGAHATRS